MVCKCSKVIIYYRLYSTGLCYCRFEVVGNYGIGYTSKIMEGIFTCLDKIFFLLRWYRFVIRNLAARKYSGKDFHGNLITRIPVCNIKFVTGKIHIHLITGYMIYAPNRYFYFLFTSEIQAEWTVAVTLGTISQIFLMQGPSCCSTGFKSFYVLGHTFLKIFILCRSWWFIVSLRTEKLMQMLLVHF